MRCVMKMYEGQRPCFLTFSMWNLRSTSELTTITTFSAISISRLRFYSLRSVITVVKVCCNTVGGM